jgi:hypothetical protein
MRVLKIFLCLFLSLTLLILIGWGITLGVLKTEQGQEWTLHTVLKYVEQETDLQVDIASVEFIFPLGLRLHHLQLATDNQMLASFDHLDLSCAPPQLLKGRLLCPTIKAQKVKVFATLGKYLESNKPPIQETSKEWEGALFPYSIKIEDLYVEDLQLDSSLVSQLLPTAPSFLKEILIQSHFHLQGKINNNPKKNSFYSHLLLTAYDAKEQHPPILVAIDCQNNALSFSLHLNHFPFEPSEFSLPFPRENIDLACFAAAPLKTWQSLIEKGEAKEAVNGSFKLHIKQDKEPLILAEALLGKETAFKGKFSWSSNEGLHLEESHLTTPYVDLNGQLTIQSDGKIQESSFAGSIYDLEALQPYLSSYKLKGKSEIQGELEGSLQAPAIHLHFYSPQLVLQEQNLENINAQLDVQMHEHILEGSLQFLSNYHHHPLQTSTNFLWQKGMKLDLHGLKFHALKTSLTGDLTVSLDSSLAEGYLAGKMEDLKLISCFLPISPLSGSSDLNIKLFKQEHGTALAVQGIMGEVYAPQIKWENLQADQLRLTFSPEQGTTLAAQHLIMPSFAAYDLNTSASLSLIEAWPLLSQAAKGTLESSFFQFLVERDFTCQFQGSQLLLTNAQIHHCRFALSSNAHSDLGSLDLTMQQAMLPQLTADHFSVQQLFNIQDVFTLIHEQSSLFSGSSAQINWPFLASLWDQHKLHALETRGEGRGIKSLQGEADLISFQLQLGKGNQDLFEVRANNWKSHLATGQQARIQGSFILKELLDLLSQDHVAKEEWLPFLQQLSQSQLDTHWILDAEKIHTEYGSADSLHITTQLRPGTQQQPQLQIVAKDLQTAEGTFNHLHFQTDWPFQAPVPFSIQGTGLFKEKLEWTAAGSWQFRSPKDLFVRIERLQGQMSIYPFQLQQPFQFQRKNDDIQFSSFYLNLKGALFLAEGMLRNHFIYLKLQGNHIPSEFLHLLDPDIPVTGKFSFLSNLEGPLDQLSGHAQLFIENIQIEEKVFANVPPLNGELLLDLASANLNLKGSFYGIGKSPILIQGHLPMALSLSPFQWKLNKQAPLTIHVTAEGELDPFLHLFYNDTTNLTGQAKIALQLTGYLENPQISGYIDLINGAYESLATGAIYRNIQARLEGNGSKLALKQFSAVDNKNGSITGKGEVLLDAAQHYPFEMHIYPSQIALLDSDFASMSASGHLVLQGNQKQGRMTGSLEANRAVLHIDEEKPKAIRTIDVTYINTLPGKEPASTKIKEEHWPLDLDIKLSLPNQASIQGKNLASEWKGEIFITGTPQHLLLNGNLRVIEGQYNLNGKVFSLTQGNIHFAGPLDKKTTLYIVASKEIEPITAEIIVKGTPQAPLFSFRSNPPLSEREVLSYILFNRGISDITSNEGAQLSHSFTSLNAASSSSTDFLSRLRNNIGIDRLDFNSGDGSDSNDFSLQVGKYIYPGVLFSINKGLNEAANRFSIEANLRKNVKAQAEVGDDGQGQLKLKWKKNY